MKSLVGFVMALCTSSQKQLAGYGYNPDGSIIISTQKQGEAGFTVGPLPVTALHLYRLGNLLMKCLHRQRPLLHTMRLWSVMAPHFVEVSLSGIEFYNLNKSLAAELFVTIFHSLGAGIANAISSSK